MIGWLALGALVACGPLVVYFLTDTGALVGRAQEVLILNGTAYMQGHLQSLFGTDDLSTILKRQLAAVPLLLSGLADQSEQYGAHYTMEDPLVAGLMLVGFWLALLRLRRPLHLLLVLWVVGTLIFGGVLTMDMPWWPRLLAMLPALCLLAAMALERMLRLLESTVDCGRRMAGWPGTSKFTVAADDRAGIADGADSGIDSDRRCVWYTVLARASSTTSSRIRHKSITIATARATPMLPTSPRNCRRERTSYSSPSGDMLWDYATIRFLAPGVQGELVRDPTEYHHIGALHVPVAEQLSDADLQMYSLRLPVAATARLDLVIHFPSQGRLTLRLYHNGSNCARIRLITTPTRFVGATCGRPCWIISDMLARWHVLRLSMATVELYVRCFDRDVEW